LIRRWVSQPPTSFTHFCQGSQCHRPELPEAAGFFDGFCIPAELEELGFMDVKNPPNTGIYGY